MKRLEIVVGGERSRSGEKKCEVCGTLAEGRGERRRRRGAGVLVVNGGAVGAM